jgi:D-3-phosphoglycerate dehydrogenase
MTEEDGQRLRALGELLVHDDRNPDEAEILRRIGPSEVIITGGVAISGHVIRSAPNLEMISIWASGFDHVDLAAASDRRVVVSNVQDYAAVAVGEHALALVFAAAKRLREADAQVREGGYDGMALPSMELCGKTFGIIGAGAVGGYLARLAQGVGCRVLAFTRRPSPQRAAQLGVRFVPLADLLRESDIVCLCAGLTPETQGMIGRPEFAMMDRHPVFVNVSRGALVDQDALLAALRSGQIRGAGLDVLAQEPPAPDEPLLREGGVIFTPHKAWVTPEAIANSTRICVDNIAAYLAGTPQNVVSW